MLEQDGVEGWEEAARPGEPRRSSGRCSEGNGEPSEVSELGNDPPCAGGTMRTNEKRQGAQGGEASEGAVALVGRGCWYLT